MTTDRHERYDPWGVGEALEMAMRMYIHTKRATGRTAMLLDALKEGDMVIAATAREANRIEHMARKRGFKDVICRTCDPRIGHNALARVHELLSQTERRVVFDHTFFEALYWWTIEDTLAGVTELVNRHNERRARTKVNDLNYFAGDSDDRYF